MNTSIQDVSSRAQNALKTSSLFALRMLTVQETKDGLLITGRVSSFYQKQQAQEVVRAVAAGTHVTNQIEVS